MKIIKGLSGVLLAISAICLAVSTVILINTLLISSLPAHLFWVVIIIVNSLITGLTSIILIKLINDTEDQNEKNIAQAKLLQEIESQNRVEENSL
jgi:nitrogen fixation/metabolism regulation signal transduction histidine kinase